MTNSRLKNSPRCRNALYRVRPCMAAIGGEDFDKYIHKTLLNLRSADLYKTHVCHALLRLHANYCNHRLLS